MSRKNEKNAIQNQKPNTDNENVQQIRPYSIFRRRIYSNIYVCVVYE